jgi:hypothetical protein
MPADELVAAMLATLDDLPEDRPLRTSRQAS